MDQAIKTMIHLLFVFLGTFLMITILTFGVVVNHARNVLSNTIEYLEINTFDPEVISDYAETQKLGIEVLPVDDAGIYSTPEDRTRYEVQVTFSHPLAWVQLSPTITIKGVTRAVEY